MNPEQLTMKRKYLCDAEIQAASKRSQDLVCSQLRLQVHEAKEDVRKAEQLCALSLPAFTEAVGSLCSLTQRPDLGALQLAVRPAKAFLSANQDVAALEAKLLVKSLEKPDLTIHPLLEKMLRGETLIVDHSTTDIFTGDGLLEKFWRDPEVQQRLGMKVLVNRDQEVKFQYNFEMTGIRFCDLRECTMDWSELIDLLDPKQDFRERLVCNSDDLRHSWYDQAHQQVPTPSDKLQFSFVGDDTVWGAWMEACVEDQSPDLTKACRDEMDNGVCGEDDALGLVTLYRLRGNGPPVGI